MDNLKFVLFCVYFAVFGSCQVTNVAQSQNGGRCSSSFANIGCTKLIDGITKSTGLSKWRASGNITGQEFTFEFTSTVNFRRIEIFHAYELVFRNIKELMIEIEGADIHKFPLVNIIEDHTGVNSRDIFDFTGLSIPPPPSDELKLKIIDMYNTSSEIVSALVEVEIYGIPTTTTTIWASSPTVSTSPILETSTESPETTLPESQEVSSKSPATTSPTTSSTTLTSSIKMESTTIITTYPSTSKSSSTSSTKTSVSTTVSTSISTTSSVTNISTNSPTLSSEQSSAGLEEVGQHGQDGSDLGLIVGLVLAFLVIVAVVLFVFFLVRRRKNCRKCEKQDGNENGYVNFSMDKIERAPESGKNTKEQIPFVDPSTEDKVSDSSTDNSPRSSVQDLKLVDGEPEYDKTQFSNAIKLDDLASTVADMLRNPVRIQDEFKSIPAGKQHPTTFADRSTLHTKNRFRNIKPYDHSRVSLVQKESDDSMYINANFISAYNQPKYYIAAQGPNKDSVDDFWRMIWEHRVPVIVMVTNCKEAGKDKCTKYWPNKEDSKQTYDDVDVVFDKNIIAADYKILDFKISKCGETRDVRQYHYTSWPDEGVPTSCSALISFVNRIREYTDDKDPPIVVHCSAGVGRTGTFIAVNYSMDMASHEKIVDIQKVVHRLREDRINMVQTLSQYKFLYALMLECLYCGEVTIPCQGASEKIQQIFIKTYGQDSPAEQQWKVLEVFKSKNMEEECLAGKHKDNIEKNRTQDIVPLENHRPYLRRRPDYTSNYINAVFVDGYKTKNKFLLTQHPLENTIVDLWRTISDFNISTIVMLNSCSDDAQTYWPEDEYSEPLKYGDFLEVTFKRVDKQDEFTITELQMSDDQEKANVVTHIQVKNVTENSKPKLSILPALFNIVTQPKMADDDSRIMIHNLNGDGNTGVYCALHQIFDKIKEEQEIDIFNAVKNTRMSRPDAISDMETYRYLHDASVQFIEQFSTYANFQ